MTLVLDPAAQDLLFREAHTAKTFTEEPVTEEQVQAIYDLVKYGPTAFNQSPLRVTLLRTAEGRERLLAHMAEGNRPKTSAAPLTAVLSYDLDFHERLPELFPHAPHIKDAFFSEEPVRESAASFNAALQAGYFLLGVRAAGLAAGPMTGFDPGGLDKEFFGDGRQRALMVVNIGKPGPDAFSPRSPRLAYDDVVTVL
ncbi:MULTISPECIES: malonic semialdehyde reductase [unclassified Streptomyces]|uniref:malonic semialdehyde reductase n=1 Tax=unclassified Streptomyces TaxID=2593676 RepID=UPI002DD97C3F|nr:MULTISPECIES: malonic semialdehyde reductase [unclassified Streptomyces]WSA92627.1 malonic semialdehyde reductase [Streptomyces sp. NBC_01795]WSB76993.1 malonic semialdehyde reductase [Streptomyces sp. NBC_01775]WSS14736.1 malonic semialdehyde reductase [Streptomyces sp. NBC_01186]WSS43566.1 malonic semialdehyde reductase [Streptomyces sp. NBC_01187]